MPNLRFLFYTSVLLFSSCCSINKEAFEFNDSELAHFSDYNMGDTIYFESNLGDVDTIMIMGYDSIKNDDCGHFMSPKPSNSKWLSIKHLPNDRWHGVSQASNQNEVQINYQNLLIIDKFPKEGITNYNINFKDFYSRSDTIIGEYCNDSIVLNNVMITNYYLVSHGYPERITKPENIERVYWTDINGMVAYQNKAGEVWVRRPLARI